MKDSESNQGNSLKNTNTEPVPVLKDHWEDNKTEEDDGINGKGWKNNIEDGDDNNMKDNDMGDNSKTTIPTAKRKEEEKDIEIETEW